VNDGEAVGVLNKMCYGCAIQLFHWSFLTGPKAKILELASRVGATLQNRNGSRPISHIANDQFSASPLKHIETELMPTVCPSSSRLCFNICQRFALMCNRFARFSSKTAGGRSGRIAGCVPAKGALSD
jgi:hypothetical protein